MPACRLHCPVFNTRVVSLPPLRSLEVHRCPQSVICIPEFEFELGEVRLLLGETLHALTPVHNRVIPVEYRRSPRVEDNGPGLISQ